MPGASLSIAAGVTPYPLGHEGVEIVSACASAPYRAQVMSTERTRCAFADPRICINGGNDPNSVLKIVLPHPALVHQQGIDQKLHDQIPAEVATIHQQRQSAI